MAEEIQKKKISELPSAVYLSDADVMPVVQGSGSSEATKKVDIGLVGSTVAESKTFSNLDTTSKTLVGAINEVNSSIGNVPSADEISYDNTSSGLSASDVQGAIDEIAQGSSGGSTVTVTQIQSTGTKIATITVDSVGTDLYAPQGGGSGHTILDDEGTSLTQRDDLQFKGAYSEDDSINEKTIVNVARTMTSAEFEQLTDDEKAGFINVKDETSGSDDKFQPVIYSETERDIGVWTDGKPLYEKTIPITVGSNQGWTTTAHNIANIDKIADCVGILDGYTAGLTAVGGIAFFANTVNVGVYNVASDFYGKSSYVTIRYTKTTDQAGSGQWTPQGVPAHHYSTDEQIVGTWVDGSTLYEKTYHNSAITIASNTELTIDDFTDKFPISCNGVLHNSTDDRTYYPNYSYAGAEQANIYYKKDGIGNLVLRSESDSWGNTWEVFTTVRYTKSST